MLRRGTTAGLSAFAVGVFASVNAATAQPNVVVFYADDLGWTDWQHHPTLNPTGSPLYETPNLLRLAESGVTFDNGYASAPVCSPSRVALLTGKNPARTGVTDHTGGGSNQSARLRSPVWNRSISSADVTIAEALGSPAGGYDTGFIGKWHAGGGPLSHGFDSNIAGGGAGCPCGSAGGFFAGSDGAWSGMPGINTPGTYPADAYLTDVLGDFAEGFIQQRAADPDPFLLMFAPYQVHVPLQAPADTVSKYQAKIAQLEGQGVDLGQHDLPVYAAMVEEMDSALGRVLDRLEDPNGDGDLSDSVRDDTIVIFASDNGGLTVSELGDPIPTENTPLREGKGSLYEGGTRSPFVVSWPANTAVSQGSVSSAHVTTHDLYATLLDATDLQDNPAVPRNTVTDSVSFLDALGGGAHDRGAQFWHYPHRSNQQRVSGGTVTGGSFVSSVRDGDMKLIFFYEDRHYELYDLSTDLDESDELIAGGSSADDAFRLSAELNRYLGEVGAGMPIDRFTGLAEALPHILWPTFQGDFDGDGVLGAGDWQALKTGFGGDFASGAITDGYASGDINLDGRVDRFDFDDFKTAYESANGVGSFARLLASVPEPASAVSFAVGVVGVGACWLRRRSR